MSGKTDLKELKAYFKSLKTPQKKQFIQNLQKKISGVKDSKYRDFLADCLKEYNNEVRSNEKKASQSRMPENTQQKKAAKEPQLSDESFAIAFAAMLSPLAPTQKSIAARLQGRWLRESGGKVLYFEFASDGTFETNETPDGEVLQGRFSTGLDGVLLLEPGEILGTNSIMLSANSLVIGFVSGESYEYRR